MSDLTEAQYLARVRAQALAGSGAQLLRRLVGPWEQVAP